MRNAAEDADFDLGEMDRELAEFVEGADGTEPEDSRRGNGRERLLSTEEADSFRERWESVQGGFVDEPRRAVEQADQLVDSCLQQLTKDLRSERDGLVRRWDRGVEDVSTEEYRQALKGYRQLFDRLLRL